MKIVIFFAFLIAVTVAIPIQLSENEDNSDNSDNSGSVEELSSQNVEQILILLADSDLSNENELEDEDDSDFPVAEFGFGKKLKKIGKKIKEGVKEVGKVGTVVEVGKGILGVAGIAAPENIE